MPQHAQHEATRARGDSLLSRLRSYCVFVPMVYLYTVVLGTLALLASLVDRGGRMQHWFARTWSSIILKTLGIHVDMEGVERIKGLESAVYAANHLSAADIPVLYASLPMAFRIMAKKELFRYPFLGWYLTRSGQIPIVYGDANASLRSLNRASECVRKGMPLVVFPEGGRAEDGHLQPFMAGAFYVAIRAHAPVVPMAIVGTYEVVPMNSFHVRPGRVQLLIGEPISTAGMRVRDVEKLSDLARQAISDMYYSRSGFTQPTEAESKPALAAGSKGSPDTVSP